MSSNGVLNSVPRSDVLWGGRIAFFFFFLNVLFLNIFRISPGLPNVTDESCNIIIQVHYILHDI